MNHLFLKDEEQTLDQALEALAKSVADYKAFVATSSATKNAIEGVRA